MRGSGIAKGPMNRGELLEGISTSQTYLNVQFSDKSDHDAMMVYFRVLLIPQISFLSPMYLRGELAPSWPNFMVFRRCIFGPLAAGFDGPTPRCLTPCSHGFSPLLLVVYNVCAFLLVEGMLVCRCSVHYMNPHLPLFPPAIENG